MNPARPHHKWVAGIAVVAAMLAPAVASADESSTLPTAINLPSGPASIEGFGQGYDVGPSNGLPGLSYPVKVPPGRNGLAPQLAFSYEAGKGAGALGIGWDFELPSIERSTRRGIPAYDSEDSLVLRGLGGSEELVEVADGVFRERIEASAPVVLEASGSGYVATTVDGTKYFFGETSDGRLTGPSGTYRWNIQAIEDVWGNRVDFAYRELAGTTEYQLAGVVWNGGAARVYFDYEKRPDVIVSRRAGFAVRLAHRLTTLRTEADDSPALTYSLEYENTVEIPSSVVTSIRCEGYDGEKMPTWRIEYAAMLAEGEDVQTLEGGPMLDPQSPTRSWVDVDGDGAPDLLEGLTGQWRYRRNVAGERLEAWSSLPNSPSVEIGPNSKFSDMDGDGVQDLLLQTSAGGSDYLGFYGGGETPFGTADSIQIQASIDMSDPRVAMVDQNGDGRIDLLFADGNDTFLWLRDYDTGSFQAPVDASGLPQNLRLGDSGVQFVDMDGDRLPDLTRIIPEDERVLVAPGLGMGEFGEPYDMDMVPGMSAGDRWELRDINGDVAADLVRVGSFGLELWMNQLDGTFAMTRALEWPELDTGETVIFSDVNANGTTDVLRVDTSGAGGWRYWDILGQQPGLLSRFENGIGYSIEFEYTTTAKSHAVAEAEGQGWSFTSPNPMPLIKSTREDDSVDWTRVVEWEFRDAYYDAERQEFRGFRQLLERQLGDDFTETSVTTSVFDLGRTDEALKLKSISSSIGAPGEPISRTEHGYTVLSPVPGVAVARMTDTSTYHIERGPEDSAIRTRSTMEFDEWGNETLRVDWGIVDRDSGEDVPGDERRTVATFAAPQSQFGPRNRVATVETTNGAGKRISASRNYYDGQASTGLSLGVVGDRGALVRTEAWTEADRWIPRGSSEYDVFGNVIIARDAVGATMRSEFDDLGRFPVREIIELDENSPLDELSAAAEWDARWGVPTKTTDTNDVSTLAAYDGLGRLRGVAKPGDSLETPTVRYRYHVDGSVFPPAVTAELLHAVPDSEGPVYERAVEQLDGLGRLRQKFSQDDRGTAAILVEARRYGPGGSVTESIHGHPAPSEYLEPGRLLEWEDAWPRASGWVDALGRSTRSKTVEGRVGTTEFRKLETVVRDNEDVAGGERYIDAPRVTKNDGLGRRIEVRDRLPNEEVLHLFEFDAGDRPTAYVDPEGNRTEFIFDGMDRVVSVLSPDAGVTISEYDNADRLIRQVDARGAEVVYDFDIVGRPVSETALSATGDIESESLFFYDAYSDGESGEHTRGRLVEQLDDVGTLRISYDERGRETERSREFKLDSGTRVLTQAQAYDPQGRVVETIYPDGKRLRRSYSMRGFEQSVGDFVPTVERDALGYLRRVEYANGMIQTRTHDREGRLLGQVVAAGDTERLHVEHEYDAAGLIERTTDRVGAGQTGPALDQSFRYDSLRRLVGADGDYGKLTWDYTASGNIRNFAGLELGYTGPKPHAATTAGAQRLEYDEAGQLRTVVGEGPIAAGEWTFDAHGRAVGFEATDGARVENVYDAKGSRAIRRVFAPSGKLKEENLYFGDSEVRDGKLVKWVVASGMRVAEVRSKGLKSTERHSAGGLLVLPFAFFFLALVGAFVSIFVPRRSGQGEVRLVPQMTAALFFVAAVAASCSTGSRSGDDELVPDKDTRWHVQDRMGSGSLVIDHQGEVIAKQLYRPFGDSWSSWNRESTDLPTYGFANQEIDDVAGAYHMGIREYLPQIGRWISPDPSAVTGLLEPRELNPFAYVINDPLNGVDPLGRETTHEWVRGHLEVVTEAVRKNVEKVGGRQAGEFAKQATEFVLEETVVESLNQLVPESVSKVADQWINGERDDVTTLDKVEAGYEVATAIMPGARRGKAALKKGAKEVSKAREQIGGLLSDASDAVKKVWKGKKAAGGGGKRFSAAKQDLVDMAKKDKKTGMTKGDMDAYKELNRELPDPFPTNKVRGPEVHPSRPHGKEPHGHVGPVDHIPIVD